MQILTEKEDKKSSIYYQEVFLMVQTRSQQLGAQGASTNGGGWAPGWPSEAHLIHNRGSINLLNG